MENGELKIIEDAGFLDKLKPVERDVMDSIASAVIYKMLQRVNNFVFALIRELESKGITVDAQFRLDKSKRGAMATIQLELKDINPKLALAHRGYITSVVSDKWTKWIAVKTLAKAVEKHIDESIENLVEKDLFPSTGIGEPEIIARIPVAGGEAENADAKKKDQQQSGANS